MTIAGSFFSASAVAQDNPKRDGALTRAACDISASRADAGDGSSGARSLIEEAPPTAAGPAISANASNAFMGSRDCCKMDCPGQTVERLFGDCCWLKCHDVELKGWIETG